MWSKNKKRPTALEGRYLAMVAALPCSVCDAEGPSEVHELKQGVWFLVAALCASCHRSDHNGLSGKRHMWKVKRMDELDALAVTVRRVFEKVFKT